MNCNQRAFLQAAIEAWRCPASLLRALWQKENLCSSASRATPGREKKYADILTLGAHFRPALLRSALLRSALGHSIVFHLARWEGMFRLHYSTLEDR